MASVVADNAQPHIVFVTDGLFDRSERREDGGVAFNNEAELDAQRYALN
jgi:hypothetical protein